MLLLGIETSTPQASVAIGSEQGVVASALVSRGASYNEFLFPQSVSAWTRHASITRILEALQSVSGRACLPE